MKTAISLTSLPTIDYRPKDDQFTGNLISGISSGQSESLFSYLREVAKELKNRGNSGPSSTSFSLEEGQELLISATFDSQNDLYHFFVTDSFSPVEALEVTQLEEDFYKILGSLYDDFTIIGCNGVIEKALPNFELMYGIPASEAEGCTIFEMERRKIFNPCVSARVFKSKQTETLMQLTGNEKNLMCTAIPVFSEDGELYKVVSYTRDVTKYEQLKDEYNKLQSTVASYSAQLEQLNLERNINVQVISESPEMRRISQTAIRIAQFDATVLLTGESGVGKSMFADIIHRNSKRADGPFISINCGAIPENLLESELFGYEKGAFTGAGKEGKAGLVELADKGTLFLDEIGDMPMHMQVKLLKMIQEKKVTRVGGVEEHTVDFRLIAATNKDIEKLIEKNLFREDLYYRLNVISLLIPPLRERHEDIFPLIKHFSTKFCNQYGVSHTYSSKAIDYLERYRWPGNIRELENVVERTLLTAEEYTITEESLPYFIYSDRDKSTQPTGDQTLKEILQNIEKQVILSCYKEHKTTTKMAEVLGISQSSASIKLSKYLGKS